MTKMFAFNKNFKNKEKCKSLQRVKNEIKNRLLDEMKNTF